MPDEKLRGLQSVANIFSPTKTRRLKRAGHLAGMAAMRNTCEILIANPDRQRIS
jgi:hypothetical protein